MERLRQSAPSFGACNELLPGGERPKPAEEPAEPIAVVSPGPRGIPPENWQNRQVFSFSTALPSFAFCCAMPVKRTARSCSDAIDFLGLFIEDGPDEVPAGGNDSTDEEDGPG